MADIVSKHVRSRMMSSIRSGNTKPELALRRALHRLGFRYRLHGPNLPGRPDLAFPRYRAVLFVHGCFWHRHEGCRFATTPSSNVEFWGEKFGANVKRDRKAAESLLAAGWRVGVVWECLFKGGELDLALEEMREFLTSSQIHYLEWPPVGARVTPIAK